VTRYVALLRAVNVGGTGRLPMACLRAMGEACRFADVATYIASVNLLLTSDDGEAASGRLVVGCLWPDGSAERDGGRRGGWAAV
jgi:uncharacterized protein (DUF1697 family)